MKKRIGILLLVLIMIMGLTGCGATSNYASSSYNGIASDSYEMAYSGYGMKNTAAYDSEAIDYAYDYDYADTEESYNSYDASNSTGTTNTLETELNYEKLVYKANVELEAQEFDKAVTAAKELITSYNGIIQTESFRDRASWDYYINYESGTERVYESTVRIPTEHYNEFMNSIGDIGHVTNTSSYVENISQEYYNNKAYLESYQNQLEVLQGMYEKAETIEELIKLEQRISEVQAQILSLTTEIRSMDMDVAYSTITMSIEEVVDYSEEPVAVSERTFWDRLGNAFKNSWDNLTNGAESILFWLIESIWGILLVLGITYVILRLIGRARAKANGTLVKKEKKHKIKKTNKQEETKTEAAEVVQETSSENTDTEI